MPPACPCTDTGWSEMVRSDPPTSTFAPTVANSQFHGSGNWAGLFLKDNSLVVGPSGAWNFTLSPTTITAATLQIDLVTGTFTMPGSPCPTWQIRGSFTKRP